MPGKQQLFGASHSEKEPMAYQVYFADLTEENQALTMALLRVKEEAETIEPDEAKLLEELRGSPTPWPQTYTEEPQNRQFGRGRRGNRRNNGRGFRNNSD